ncbi:MAG TPA: hypothetical protein VN641_10450 [Urbifossiella sp.]|nr:hypothetical protein [Urbifossiella sp.]
MKSHLQLAILASLAALTASASPASAQFIGGGFRTPGFHVPGVNFNYASSARFSVGGLSFGYNLYGPVGYGIARQMFSQQYNPAPPRYSSYMSGGFGSNPAAARNFGRAQQAAAYSRYTTNTRSTRNAIYDQWAYERLGVQGLTAVQPGSDEAPPELLKALSNASEAEIASGEALNHIVVGIVAAEKKGRAESAFLPPNLLAQLRFTGPNADAINMLRRVGQLQFPKVFDDPAFAELKPVLEKDLAAAAAPVLVGKAADPTKTAKLAADVARARAILDPITRNLEFEDATAARRFLNHLDSLVAALKASGSSGLVDPRWSTEGTSVADLIKYMVKNKLLFGPVAKGEEDAYTALHRGLVGYLYVLTEGQKKPAPKTK